MATFGSSNSIIPASPRVPDYEIAVLKSDVESLRKLVKEIDYNYYNETFDFVDIAISNDDLDILKVFIEEIDFCIDDMMFGVANNSPLCLEYLTRKKEERQLKL